MEHSDSHVYHISEFRPTGTKEEMCRIRMQLERGSGDSLMVVQEFIGGLGSLGFEACTM
jgi:hypothetical protein